MGTVPVDFETDTSGKDGPVSQHQKGELQDFRQKDRGKFCESTLPETNQSTPANRPSQ